METNKMVVYIDSKEVPVEGEKNLLELIRKAKIELPTFCYHSELSVYGACRLCMVNVEGRGLCAACSTPPENGMKVRTQTEEIREMRRIIVELLLANHDMNCTLCPKSATCQLQDLARRLGIKEVRFKAKRKVHPIDNSTHSIVRDPNKCVLCGDCVRVCSEIQSVGAIDFAHRGSNAAVLPCFGKNLDKVECVYCGQCARVCPTGALTPKSEVEAVWKALDNPEKTVVVQIAPAVRVALGEMFGLEPGTTSTGQMVAALKQMGFDKVFDTSFAADLTVVEEANEFLTRFKEKKKLPQFTSCCPAWVKFTEQYYPEMTNNLSSCRSPQQMFGSLAKEVLPKTLGVKKEDLVIVSIMPCTAKKFEAKREEFIPHNIADVDHVITTQELARMIEESGMQFNTLEPESFDLPLGFKTGAGVIFGNSGGVAEAVLRYAAGQLSAGKIETGEFAMVRGESGLREATVKIGDLELKLAVVHGLANARRVMDMVKSGKAKYDLIEVMACPGGCIGGAGQPVYKDISVRQKRTKGLYENDRMLEVHKSQDNPYVMEVYKDLLGKPNSEKAHKLLHTKFHSHKRISRHGMTLVKPLDEKPLEIDVCFGTGCFLKGSQKLMKSILGMLEDKGLQEKVGVKASFCFEKCAHGPTVKVGEQTIEASTLEKVKDALEQEIKKQ